MCGELALLYLDSLTVSTLPHPLFFMRAQIAFPDGIPAEANIASKDVNGIQVPMSAQPKGMQSVLIDFAKKTAE